MCSYFNQILSKRQCGFRQGRNTRHNLFIIEKLTKNLDNNGKGGMLSTDLSKALDCLRRNLLIAKLAAYCFGQPSLCFIYSYLSDRTQRTKVSNVYSFYTNVKYGVPQASILGSLLFNIDKLQFIFVGL